MGISTDHLIANGVEGLERVLEALLEKTKQNPEVATQPYYILYQLGSQKSLIKVDTVATPFRIWYYDLMGRPATKAVQNTIAKFIVEKCGVQTNEAD